MCIHFLLDLLRTGSKTMPQLLRTLSYWVTILILFCNTQQVTDAL